MLSAFAALCLALAFAALDLFTFLDSQGGAGTMTSAPLLDIAAELLSPLGALGALCVAVALTYHHLSRRRRHAAAAPVAAGAGNERPAISGLVIFVLCVSAGTLEFIVFGHGQAAGGGGGGGAGHGVHAHALGLAALRALPAAATATFFLGMMLIIIAHVRAGGAVVAGDATIQGLLRVLTKVAAGAAAALVGLMAMALTLYL